MRGYGAVQDGEGEVEESKEPSEGGGDAGDSGRSNGDDFVQGTHFGHGVVSQSPRIWVVV